MDAIRFTGEAWKRVQSDSIVSCWKNTGILPQNPAIDSIENFLNLPSDSDYDNHIVQSLIDQLAPDDPLSASEYITIDSTAQSTDILDDDEIVSLVQGNEVEEEDSEPIKHKITIIDAIESVDKLTSFIMQEEGNLNISINFSHELSNVKKSLCRQLTDSKVQSKISNYFSNY